MKYSKQIAVCIILVMSGMLPVKAQKKSINVGSNNGKYILIDNTKLYYEQYGKGTPLLLLHGGLSSMRTFKYVIPELSKHFRVIAVDAPGQGRSEQADSVSFQLMADYYSKMIDQLKLDSVYVWGFSVGCITAFHLAADRPDKVKMLVAHSGVSNLAGWNEGFMNTTGLTPEFIEQNVKWWLDGHMKTNPQKDKWKKFINDFRNMWKPDEFISDEKLQKIKCQTLYVMGDKDLVRPEHGLKLHDLIKGSEFCILPNTTHFILDENPTLINTMALDFLLKKKIHSFRFSY